MNGLKGIKVLITRPLQQADNLCRLIETHGGKALRFPTINVIAQEPTASIAASLKTVKNFQWLVFISANAVNFALRAINGKIDQLNDVRIAAIGSATAKALSEAGVEVDLVPAGGFDSESLLAMPALHNVLGQRFLVVRGQGGRDLIAGVLRERGAQVEFLEVYKREIPKVDSPDIIARLNCGQVDVVTVTSGEALHNLMTLLGETAQEQLVGIPLVVGSIRIANIASELGFKRIYTADSPTDASILETVLQCTTGEKSGRIE